MTLMKGDIHELALCSGIGGITRGLRAACPRVRTVCHVEREAFPAAVMAARMADGGLDDAPIWNDLQTFDARPWRGAVDLVSAGFPCQPWSAGGQRKKTDDDRWLWPAIASIIRDVQPERAVFLENVAGLVHGGIHHVLWDLAQEGFDAEWGVYRALDVGAPHRRPRLFILAYRPSELDGLLRATPQPDSWRNVLPDGVADSGDDRRIGGGEAHVDTAGLHGADGRDAAVPTLPGTARPVFPPAPCEEGRWRGYVDAGGPLPAVRRGADGLPTRVERLRALGNAVVPAVVARAWRELLKQAEQTRREHIQ